MGAPTRLVRREESCATSALYLTRRNDPLTMVPGVTPERRERPPETASPLAWSAATTAGNDKTMPMAMSRFAMQLTRAMPVNAHVGETFLLRFQSARRYDR